MLEQMRKSSQSLLIYVLFGIVIAVFIINFGPQSRGGCDAQMAGNDHFAAKVAGNLISSNDFRYGFLALQGARFPLQEAKRRRLKETVMDLLIERELLGQEAQRLGYQITDDEVEDQIADAKIITLGYPRTVPQLQKDGKFSYEAFKTYAQYELGVTPKRFIEEQKKEMLAARVRDLLGSSVAVSPEEVKADFARRGRQVNLEYVRFSPERYKSDIAPTDAEIADYVAKNDAKLKAAYEEHKFVYENAPKKVHLRQILIKPAEGAGTGADADKAAAKKADAIMARLKKGEDFAKVAKEASQDQATRARGGDLGWRAKGTTGLSSEDEGKLFAAKAGDLVGPVKESAGVVITKVEGLREGTISYDQAKPELAESKLREERAEARAKSDAEAALAKAKAAPTTTTLKQLYPGQAEDKSDKADKGEEASKPVAGVQAPRAEETGLTTARWTQSGLEIEGIGQSTALAKAAFALTPEAPVAGPFDVAGSYLVVRLKERKEPDMAELDKKKPDLERDAKLVKWMEVLTDWTHARCVEAKDAKRIQVNPEVLRYEDSQEPPPYEPCISRRSLGG
jgi:peptidyl-prolyl cis-trans isomerase D